MMKLSTLLSFVLFLSLTSAGAQNIFNIDTLAFDVICGNKDSATIYIPNSLSSATTFSAEMLQDTAQKDFNADFENGTILPFINQSPATFNGNISQVNSASGSNHLTLSGTAFLHQGLRAKFAKTKPTELSYYTKFSNNNNFHSVIHIGYIDENGDQKNIFHTLFRYGELRMYHLGTHTSMSASQNTWYKVELKNIDYVNQNYDVYVNGVLRVNNGQFNNPVDALSGVDIFSLNNTNSAFDAILIDDGTQTFSVLPTPSNDSIPANDSIAMKIVADGYNLAPGVYHFSCKISSPNAALDTLSFPIKVTIKSGAKLSAVPDCKNFGVQYVSDSYIDSIRIENKGCEDLQIYGVVPSLSEYFPLKTTDTISAGKSAYFPVQFTPTAIGTFAGKLYFQTNYDTVEVCVSGRGNEPPIINVTNTLPIKVTLNNCNDTVPIVLNIKNAGLGDLDYWVKMVNDTVKVLSLTAGVSTSYYNNVKNVFSTYADKPYTITEFSNGTTAAFASLLQKSHVLLMPPTFNSQSAQSVQLRNLIQQFVSDGGKLIVCGTSYHGNIRDLNIFDGYTNAQFGTGGLSLDENSDFLNHPILKGLPSSNMSTNRTYYAYINNVGKKKLITNPTNQAINVVTEVDRNRGKSIYIAFDYNQTNAFTKKILANTFNHYGYDKVLEAPFYAAMDNGIVAAGNTANVIVNAYYQGQPNGIYYDTLLISSNDTTTPFVKIPVEIEVNSFANIESNEPCIDFGNLTNSSPVTDSVIIKNTGCDTLKVNNITFSNAQFSSNISSINLAPGDSTFIAVQFVPAASGVVQEKMFIHSNDSTLEICLTANLGLFPSAYYNYSIVDPCAGNVNFSDGSGNNPSTWTWDFGDGNVSSQQNPSHKYERPGTYQVKLFVSNAFGIDSILQTISMNDVLFVKAGIPDTIAVNQPAQFYDSCQVATSLQWYFGDGGTSTAADPVHTYQNKGTYFLVLLASNSVCNGSETYQITVIDDIGFAQNEWNGIEISPVPAHSRVQIKWPSTISLKSIAMYDALGQKVLSQTALGNKVTLSVEQLPNGLYFINLTNSQGRTHIEKLIVQH